MTNIQKLWFFSIFFHFFISQSRFFKFPMFWLRDFWTKVVVMYLARFQPSLSTVTPWRLITRMDVSKTREIEWMQSEEEREKEETCEAGSNILWFRLWILMSNFLVCFYYIPSVLSFPQFPLFLGPPLFFNCLVRDRFNYFVSLSFPFCCNK